MDSSIVTAVTTVCVTIWAVTFLAAVLVVRQEYQHCQHFSLHGCLVRLSEIMCSDYCCHYFDTEILEFGDTPLTVVQIYPYHRGVTNHYHLTIPCT